MIKKKKKISVAKMKGKAWTLFSIMIRLRDSDEFGFGRCCSCWANKHWKELQCGHFISRRHTATLFDERNNNAQCQMCNIWNQGNTIGYWQFMEHMYGRPVIDELIALSKTSKRFTIPELEIMIELFKTKIKAYEATKTTPM